MAITDLLVLPSDVILAPVVELPAQVRQLAACGDDDYAITRPWARSPTSIVGKEAAALIELFREPTTVVDAVIRYSGGMNVPPEQTLVDAYPLLQRLMSTRLLVPADSEATHPITASFAAGALIGEFTVLRSIRALEDTEIYHVRMDDGAQAAVKIRRSGNDRHAERMLEREAAILQHLAGSPAPRLVAVGEHLGRPFLASEWCSGVPVTTAAQEWRTSGDQAGRSKLLSLCIAVAEAYAHLHARGVTHGDVHPDNVLVQNDGSVKIIDYGLARWDASPPEIGEPERGGVGFFFEPEYARRFLAGSGVPQASCAGEQYALGALLYLLVAGVHYVEFGIDQDEVFRQIADDAPLPFAQRGIAEWPALERVVSRALAKDPTARFPSVAVLVRELHASAAPAMAEVRLDLSSGAHEMEPFLQNMIERMSLDGELLANGLTTAPICSLTHGMAGVAYALYRLACIHNDAALLAVADVWATRAARTSRADDAFESRELEMTRDTIGATSPYHTETGIACVQALIAGAMGDDHLQNLAIDAFVAGSELACDELDLALGRSGTLLASSLLLDSSTHADLPSRPRLLALGQRTMKSIWGELAAFGPVGTCHELAYLGMAHGWAGILYAVLRWSRSSGQPSPAAVEDRLRELAGCAEQSGRGLQWKWALPLRADEPAGYMPGWCHGSAGYVHLWTLAHAILGDENYLVLAEGAAWHAWEGADRKCNLCCGLAGRAYALLRMFKHTGERIWLRRAEELAKRAASGIGNSSIAGDRLHANSLYKGDLGVALLIADLAQPASSCMPFFEDEG